MDDEGTRGESGNGEDIGPFIVDRSGGKVMPAGGDSSGGGGFIDPSYEEALRILGRESAMPQPWEQRALTMTDDEAVDLASRLTRLRSARNDLVEAAIFENDPVIEELITSLQERPVPRERVLRLRDELVGTGAEVAEATAAVLEHPGIKALLTDED